jgi:prephenate dehydrogenase
MRWAAEHLPAPPRVQFIGSHPMAGSEKSGPEAAREDLYEMGACLVCKPEGGAGEGAGGDEALARVAWLWRSVGMRIIECTAKQHDVWVAAVSHLPHAIASSLVKAAAADPAALETAASGFIDTSRIASGDVTMWVDILMTNREAVVEVIDRFNRELGALQDAVRSGDEQAIRAMLTRAKELRDAFIAKRKAMAIARVSGADPSRPNHPPASPPGPAHLK